MREPFQTSHARKYALSGFIAFGVALVFSFQNCAQNYKLKVSDVVIASEEAYAYYQGEDSPSNFSPAQPAAAGANVHFLITDSAGSTTPSSAFFSTAQWDMAVTKVTYTFKTSIHPVIAALPGGVQLQVFYLKMYTDDGAVNEVYPLVVFASANRPSLMATVASSFTAGSVVGLKVAFSTATVARMRLRVAAVGAGSDFVPMTVNDTVVPIGSTSVTIPMVTIRGTPSAPRSYTLNVTTEADDNLPATSTSINVQD